MKRWPSPWRAILPGWRICATGWRKTVPPCPCSTRRASPETLKSSTRASWRTALANELIHKVRAQARFFIMGAAQIDLGEDILIAQHAAIGIDIDHHAIDLEQGDHLLHILIHHQSVGLARRLID